MKKIMLAMVLGVAVAVLVELSYGQFYEPEHLWHQCGADQGDWFGYCIAGINDVNGDGCEDFLTSESQGDSGVVQLFYGGDPPDSLPDLIIRNPYPYGYFAYQVENVGDVNGDGCDDFAVMGGYSQDNIDRVFIYFGGSLLDTIPDVELSEVTYMDVFGSNIKGVGDVNGDGFDDVAVGALNYDNSRSKVWIYFGGNPMDSIADWEAEGTNQHVDYGQCITGKGDLNGDGYDDFVIYEWTGHPNLEQISYYIYYGGNPLDTIPDVIINGESYYPEIAILAPSALIANLRGGSYSDLVIGAGRTTNAVVFHGGNPMDTVIDLVLQGFETFPIGYGMNVSAVGNVNGDSYDDIIASQPDANNYGGRVLVFFGSPWMSGQPDIRWDGQSIPGYELEYGYSLTDCGDINGDGVDDIIFGYPGTTWYSPWGCVDIWKGDTAFVVNVPEVKSEMIPHCFRLLPPYPNPFNSSVTIPFEIFQGLLGDVTLKIYNVLGQEVMDLTAEVKQSLHGQISGISQLVWNGKDQGGADTGSGIYFVELKVKSFRQIEKVVLLR